MEAYLNNNITNVNFNLIVDVVECYFDHTILNIRYFKLFNFNLNLKAKLSEIN